MSARPPEEERLSAWMPEAWLYLGLAVTLGTFALENIDTGWHILMGEWARHNGLLHRNVFSFVDPSHPYVGDKWLFQVATSYLNDLASVKGMVLVRVLLVLGLAAVMFRAAGRAGRSSVGALVLGIALLASSPRFLLRPDFVTLLFLAWHMRWVLAASPPRRRAWLGAFGLQVLWTNLHGYFVLGPLLWAAVGVGRALMRATGNRQADVRTPLGFLVACSAGSLLHAYGLAGVAHPLVLLQDVWRHHGDYLRAIPELRPTLAAHWLPGPLMAFGVLAAASALLAAWRHRHLDFGATLVVVMAFVQSIGVMRNIGLFAVVAGPWLLVEGRALFAELPRRRIAPMLLALRPLAWLLLLAMAAWQVTGKTAVSNRSSRFAGFGMNVDVYPIEEVQFLIEQDLRERVAAPLEWGGFLLWRLRPVAGVFIDGNTDGYAIAHLNRCWRLFAGVEDPWMARQRDDLGAYLTPWESGLARRLWSDARFVPVFGGRVGLVFLAAEDAEAMGGFEDLRRRVTEGWVPPVGQSSKWWRAVYPRPLFQAAAFFVDVQEAALAERLLAMVPDAATRLPETQTLRAAVEDLTGRRRDALNRIDRVCLRSPDLAEARVLRAGILQDEGVDVLALADLRAAVEEDPYRPDWWSELGLLQERRGDRRGALASLRHAADLAPASLRHVRPLVERLSHSALPEERREARRRVELLLRQDLSDFDRVEARQLARP